MTTENPDDGFSREEVRRALQKVEIRAAQEVNADRAAAFREAGSIVEHELFADDGEED